MCRDVRSGFGANADPGTWIVCNQTASCGCGAKDLHAIYVSNLAAAFVEESCCSIHGEICCGGNPSGADVQVPVQNRDRTMCRFTTPSDACTPVHTLVLKGPVQQALLLCNNARAAGRTQARRLLRFDTQASIAAN